VRRGLVKPGPVAWPPGAETWMAGYARGELADLALTWMGGAGGGRTADGMKSGAEGTTLGNYSYSGG